MSKTVQMRGLTVRKSLKTLFRDVFGARIMCVLVVQVPLSSRVLFYREMCGKALPLCD